MTRSIPHLQAKSSPCFIALFYKVSDRCNLLLVRHTAAAYGYGGWVMFVTFEGLSNKRNSKLLSVVEQICVANVEVLLFGSTRYSYDENNVIFKSVEMFIIESNRLL